MFKRAKIFQSKTLLKSLFLKLPVVSLPHRANSSTSSTGGKHFKPVQHGLNKDSGGQNVVGSLSPSFKHFSG